MRFVGKRALVTGAASGIGRATALLFANEGARVAIADINSEGLAETADLMAEPPTALVYDASDLSATQAMVRSASTDGLDILCNVAGLLKWGSSLDFPLEDFERVLKINTSSVFAACQAALPELIRSKGVIVNVASTAALQGAAYMIAYTASKHAVAAITKGLAVEFASVGVRVNAVCPGQVRTPMTTSQKPPPNVDWQLVMRNAPKLADGICEPEDIAAAIAFLASDQARKATGSLLPIDAGLLAG